VGSRLETIGYADTPLGHSIGDRDQCLGEVSIRAVTVERAGNVLFRGEEETRSASAIGQG